jgi:uncharacterized membrane protein
MSLKKDPTGSKMFIMGAAIFAVGLFFGYGIIWFGGAALMIAGMLPPAGDEHDPL